MSNKFLYFIFFFLVSNISYGVQCQNREIEINFLFPNEKGRKEKSYTPLYLTRVKDIQKNSCKSMIDLKKIKQLYADKTKQTAEIYGHSFQIPQGLAPSVFSIYELGRYRKSCCHFYKTCCEKALKVKAELKSFLQKVAKKCSPDFNCLIKNTFKDESGYLVLYLKYKYNLNTSRYNLYGEDIKDDFSEEELISLIHTFEQLPQTLVNRYFTQNEFATSPEAMIHDEFYPQSVAKKSIALFNPLNNQFIFFQKWREATGAQKKLSFFHEIGHMVESVTDKLYLDYKALISTKGARAADDSHTSFRESFANDFTLYRFRPGVLKKADPSKIKFFKKHVFDGIYYNKKNKCNR